MNKRKELRQKWFQIVEKIQKPMLQAVYRYMLKEEEKLKFMASTTHLEIQKGIIESKSPESTSLCYKREFSKVPDLSNDEDENRIIGRYFDVDSNGNVGANKIVIENLRRDVCKAGSKTSSFITNWHPLGVEEITHAEYLDQFGKCVKDDFIKYIKDATRNKNATKSCVEEAATHLTFCASRADTFHGREYLVRKTLMYAQRKKGGGNPLIVYGDSGAGKTSLLAKLAMASQATLSRNNARPVLVIRFRGTSIHVIFSPRFCTKYAGTNVKSL